MNIGGGGGGPGGSDGLPPGSINPQALQAALQQQQQRSNGNVGGGMGAGVGGPGGSFPGGLTPALLQQLQQHQMQQQQQHQQHQQQQQQPFQQQQGIGMGMGNGNTAGGGSGAPDGSGGGGQNPPPQGAGSGVSLPPNMPPENAVKMITAIRSNMTNLQAQWGSVSSTPDSLEKQQSLGRLAGEMRRMKGLHDQLLVILRSQSQNQQQQTQAQQGQQGQQNQQQPRPQGNQAFPVPPSPANASMEQMNQQQARTAAGAAGSPDAASTAGGQSVQHGSQPSFSAPQPPQQAFSSENPQHQAQLAVLQAFAQQQQQRQQQQSQSQSQSQPQHQNRGMVTPQQGNVSLPPEERVEPSPSQPGGFPPHQQQQQQQQHHPQPPQTPQQQAPAPQQQPPQQQQQTMPLPPGLANTQAFVATITSFMGQRGTPLPPGTSFTFQAPAGNGEIRKIELNAAFAAVTGLGGSTKLSTAAPRGQSPINQQGLMGWVILANRLGLAVANPDPNGEGRRDQIPTPAQTPERLRNWYRELLGPFEEWWVNKMSSAQAGQSGQPGQTVQQGPSGQAGQPPAQGPPPTPQREGQPPQTFPPLPPNHQQALQQLGQHLQRLVAEGQMSQEDARNRWAQASNAARAQALKAQQDQQQQQQQQQGQPVQQQQQMGQAGPADQQRPGQGPWSAHGSGMDQQAFQQHQQHQHQQQQPLPPHLQQQNQANQHQREISSPAPSEAEQKGKKRSRKSTAQKSADAKVAKMEHASTPSAPDRGSRQGSMQSSGPPQQQQGPSMPAQFQQKLPPGQQQQQQQQPAMAPGPGGPAQGQLTPRSAVRMLQQGNLNPAQQAAALAAVRAASGGSGPSQHPHGPQSRPVTRDGGGPPGPQGSSVQQGQQQQQQPSAAKQETPAPPPHPPNKFKIEYLPLQRDVRTYAGWDLDAVEAQVGRVAKGYNKSIRTVREMGVVDVTGLILSLRSRLEIEVSYALNSLLILSSGAGTRPDSAGLKLDACGDLLEELLELLRETAFVDGPPGEDRKEHVDTQGSVTPGIISHSQLVFETLQEEEDLKLLRRNGVKQRAQSLPARAVEDLDAPLVKDSDRLEQDIGAHRRTVEDDRTRERKANIALTLLNILCNFSTMVENHFFLGSNQELLVLLGDLISADDGQEDFRLFTRAEQLKVRKDVLLLLTSISGPGLQLRRLPVATVTALFDLYCSFMEDAAEIEALGGPLLGEAPPPPGVPPHMAPRLPPVPWAARTPYYADLALDGFSKFALPDENRKVLSEVVPASKIMDLCTTLAQMFPSSEADYHFFRTETRLCYTEHIAMSLYNLVFLAPLKVKLQLRNGTAGWTSTLFRVVKRVLRFGSSDFSHNQFSSLAYRLVETLKLVDDSKDMFNMPLLLSFSSSHGDDSGSGSGSGGQDESGHGGSGASARGSRKRAPLLAAEEEGVFEVLSMVNVDPVLLEHLSSMVVA